MTRVLARCADGRCVLTAEGHAGALPACAGVSALTLALCGWLDARPAGLTGAPTLTQAPGRVTAEAAGDGTVYAAFAVAVTGLRQLAEAFPRGVTVETEGF